MDNRPHGREKHITGAGKDIQKKGGGLHSEPVGRTGGMPNASSGRATGQTRASGGGLIKIIIIAALLLGGGGAGVSGLLGGFGGGSTESAVPSYTQQPQVQQTQQVTQQTASSFDLGSLFSSGTITSTSSGWNRSSNVGKLNTEVAQEAREKRTVILGNGSDTVTVMVYMCGTDLESRSGMASSDLQEMINATLSGNVNVIVYTGGCSQWKNSVISSKVNQIYKIEDGGIKCLVKDAGDAAMTKPATLTGFIEYCTKNYPANRNELILWDHGGGSISGYGYDQKYQSAGSMTLKGISEALQAAETSFDFIGFDACLMATLENALTVAPYADYLIASEETEPGVGWYYTNWLTALSQNPSMSTLEIGKKIADDFVSVCARSCSGQKTTLSVVDLSELESTVPEAFKAFASDTAGLLQNDQYKTVSDARSTSREFAVSSKVDQVDLVDLAYNMETEEGKALAEAILGAVKYNNTSSNMTNAYGLSIYFPYQKTGKVDSAVAAYNAIGIDSEYSRCIQKFASLETGGQAVSGSTGTPLSTLLGGSNSSSVGSDMISSILSGLLSGNSSSYLGKSLDVESDAQYLTANRFDASALIWTENNGTYEMVLSEDQWSLVHDLELNVFFDDGEGYIDLGCDNVFDFTESGALKGSFDGTWLAVNDQPVAYYYIDTVEDGENYTVTGRIPVLLNGSRADLMIVFDNAHPYGTIAGARIDYRDNETETVAKSMTGLSDGDEIIFLCDYYSYDGQYRDSYALSDPWVYQDAEEVTISNVYIDASAASALYKFTDLYNQEYWTALIPKE